MAIVVSIPSRKKQTIYDESEPNVNIIKEKEDKK